MKAIEEVARLAAKIADGSMSPNEPIFVLRAQDKLAPGIVQQWAWEARRFCVPDAKIAEAVEWATVMEQWPTKQIPGRPCTRGIVDATTNDAGEG